MEGVRGRVPWHDSKRRKGELGEGGWMGIDRDHESSFLPRFFHVLLM
jgi:hypothetical protein